MIGNFGDAEVLSFHATKFLNTFEGGAVVTNDDELAAKIRLMKNFGFAGYDKVIYIGTNGKMTEVAAAMGLTGLESLDQFILTNRHNYQEYKKELSGLPGIHMITYDERQKNNYQHIVLEIDEVKTHVSRDQWVEILHSENILARRYFYPGCHRMEPYRSYFPNAGLMLPVTEKLSERVLVLPTGTAVGHEDIIKICQLMGFVLTKGPEVRRRLEHRVPRHASG
jgi:dTDP-4-amino-4,6-dideoxygalactose transaminase